MEWKWIELYDGRYMDQNLGRNIITVSRSMSLLFIYFFFDKMNAAQNEWSKYVDGNIPRVCDVAHSDQRINICGAKIRIQIDFVGIQIYFLHRNNQHTNRIE